MKKIHATEILPGKLYQRGEFKHLRDRAEQLRAAGIGIVVNTYDDPDTELPGVIYHSLKMSDGRMERNDADQIKMLAAAVAHEIRALKKPALVHCQAGRNRSGLVSALIVRELLRCTGSQARHIVQARKPNSLTNEHFCAYLNSLGVPE